MGEFRAPKSRDNLNETVWYCLEHIREHNKAWNFYEGMTEEQIEAEIRNDTIGRRPTWPFGTRSAAFRFQQGRFDDTFGMFEAEEAEAETISGGSRQWPPGSPENEAMAVMDLTPPVTLESLKARYKQLVKRYHPDANGGDKTSEERFKQINQAYHVIMQSLAT